MLKWEKYEKIRGTLKKVDGLLDEDIDELFEMADATGMPITDEMLPFLANLFALKRSGKTSVSQMENLIAEFKSESSGLLANIKGDFEHFAAKFKEMYEVERTNLTNQVEVLNEFRASTLSDVKKTTELQKTAVKSEIELISKTAVADAIRTVSDDLTDHVRQIADGVSDAVLASNIEIKARDMLKLSEKHRRTQALTMVSAAGLIVLTAISVGVYTHITTRDSVKTYGNVLIEYARKPDAEKYIDWLRLYDENAHIIARTCGAHGDKIVDQSGLCTPTIRISDTVDRFFTGNGLMSQLENWFLTRSSYTIAFITFLTTMASLIFVPLIFQNRYVKWCRNKLNYLYRNRLFNSNN
ncbi:hypothetical protein [Brucella gallinifaecis]|uniref:hypothetical protein n=1 Tax=Brucella gallinifaecis TaxID=215590 RepID=UPI002362CEF8|nr:hypothetical protein [Brucella gallinifaecis]